MAKKTAEYGNDSITMLKGPDRVRKRPAVIFGSDGLEGCEHSFFEILSNKDTTGSWFTASFMPAANTTTTTAKHTNTLSVSTVLAPAPPSARRNL